MQQVSNAKGGQIIFDSADWKAGLGAGGKFNSAVSGKKVTGNGFQTIEAIDPFSSYGALSPAFAPSATATNAGGLAGTLLAFEVQDNTNALAIDRGGKVHSVAYITPPGVINASPHTITGTNPVAQDCLLYRRRASATTWTTSFFYSYYNNANWDVGCITDATVSWASVTFDDDFMSSVPTNPLDITTGDGDSVEQRTMPHSMCVGSDDILYIGSGRYLHAYDGDTGTQGQFYSKVLTLPAGTQIIGMRKFNDELLIAVNYYSTSSSSGVGQAFVYRWNYRDGDPTAIIPLEDNYVSSIFIWRGAPTVVTSGLIERNGNVKVKVLSGNSVIKLADFDGDVPIMRGVVNANDVVYMNCGGEIVSIGDRFNKSNAVNHIGTLGSADLSGGLFYDANSSDLVLWGGSSSSTTYSFTCISGGNGHGAGNARTFSYFPTFPQGKIGKITGVTVEYLKILSAGGTNGAFSLTLYPDDGNTYTLISAKSSVAVPLTKKYMYTTSGGNLPQFTAFEMYASWTAGTGGGSPLVSKITIEYDLVDLTV